MRLPLSSEVARSLLSFDSGDIDRMNQLAALGQNGELTADEQSELESYLHVSGFIAIMQSRARQILNSVPTNGGA